MRWIWALAIAAAAIGGGTWYYNDANRFTGHYHYVSAHNVQASLVITGTGYTICYQGCRSGKYRRIQGEGFDMVQFQSAAMETFGKAVNAPIENDIDGRPTAVRFSVEPFITGTQLQGGGELDDYDHFQREYRPGFLGE